MELKSLIERALDNNRAAQRALVDRYANYVHAIALRYAKSPEDAQDIVQDSFIRLFQKLELYRDNVGSFKSWLAKLTVRVALNKYKRFYNQREFSVETWTREPEIEPEIYMSLRMEQLLSVINQLQDGYRQVFNLYCIDGFSHREISTELSIPESTSRAMLSRAKAKLRKILLDRYAYDYKHYSDGSI